jgi:hypothetical protein
VIRGSEEIKEPLSYLIMGSARPTCSGNGFGTILAKDRFDAAGNLSEGIFPRDLLPGVFSSVSGAFQGVIQPCRMMEILNHVSASGTAF